MHNDFHTILDKSENVYTSAKQTWDLLYGQLRSFSHLDDDWTSICYFDRMLFRWKIITAEDVAKTREVRSTKNKQIFGQDKSYCQQTNIFR